MTNFRTTFGPDTGGPSEFYRIPSMITTKTGVVVAAGASVGCQFSFKSKKISDVKPIGQFKTHKLKFGSVRLLNMIHFAHKKQLL